MRKSKDLEATWISAGIPEELTSASSTWPKPTSVQLLKVRFPGEVEPERVLAFEGWSLVERPVKRTSLLLNFARLADSEPERMARFAQRFGALQLCEHGLPAPYLQGHGEPIPCKLFRAKFSNGDTPLIEKVSTWKKLAGQASAALSLAAALQKGDLGAKRDWDALDISSLVEVFWKGRPLPRRVEGRRMFLGLFVARWLELGNCCLSFDWDNARPRMSIGARGLFGHLALELAAKIARAKGIALCVECNKLFEPDRHRQAGRDHFCDACREDGAPERWASARYYERQKLKKKSNGSPKRK